METITATATSAVNAYSVSFVRMPRLLANGSLTLRSSSGLNKSAHRMIVTGVLWALLFNPLLLVSVNAPLAQSRGVRARLTEYAFTAIVAVAVMVSIRWVGVMLINSLLILPAAASRNVARSAAGYMRLSVLFALVCGVAGLALSFYLNTSAGASVVLLLAAVYFVTLPLRRK